MLGSPPAWVPWIAGALALVLARGRIARQIRVVKREVNSLRQVLMNFTADQLAGQPLPEQASGPTIATSCW